MQFTKPLIQRGSVTYKVLNIFKVLLVPVTFGFVFYKLYYAYRLPDLYSKQQVEFDINKILLVLITAVLAIVNWLIESEKWRILVNVKEPMAFTEAVKGVLSGVTLGMITPNQIGNFVGRVIHLKELSKIRGTLVSVIGNTAQMMMTMIFGVGACILFVNQLGYTNEFTTIILLIILVVLSVISLGLYYHIWRISDIFKQKSWAHYLDAFTGYNKGILSKMLLFSLSRYTIFVTQYLLLSNVYGIEISTFQILVCTMGTLFIQAFVPSFILLDVGIRGASALWLFGYFTVQATSILLMTYSIWIINILMPGLIGLVYILKWRVDS